MESLDEYRKRRHAEGMALAFGACPVCGSMLAQWQTIMAPVVIGCPKGHRRASISTETLTRADAPFEHDLLAAWRDATDPHQMD